jgi:Lrp/AsnC family leucine-responsive transcriptional regulator
VIASQKIDEIDAKILRDLLVNGRKEFTEIANEAGVSKDIIWQHYRKMKKEGLITGATVQLYYRALGYNFSASFFVSAALEKQDDVAAGLEQIPGIYGAYRCGCNSELWAIGTLKNTAELEYAKQSIKKLNGVLGLRTEIWTGNRNNPENLSILHTKEQSKEHAETKQLIGSGISKKSGLVDSIDEQIIEKLATNGRVSFNKMAKELKISTDTVARRYNKLRKGGVIRTVIQINPTKLGYVADAIISIVVAPPGNLAEIIEKLTKIPDVIGIWKIAGAFDLEIFAKLRTLEQLISIQEEVSGLPGIMKMETVLLTKFPIMPYPKEHMSNF